MEFKSFKYKSSDRLAFRYVVSVTNLPKLFYKDDYHCCNSMKCHSYLMNYMENFCYKTICLGGIYAEGKYYHRSQNSPFGEKPFQVTNTKTIKDL